MTYDCTYDDRVTAADVTDCGFVAWQSAFVGLANVSILFKGIILHLKQERKFC